MVRFHPQWQRVRALVRDGRIGAVRALQAAFTFPLASAGNVRNRLDYGGGALYDVGCYPIVAARYVFGADAERAVALIDRDPDSGVDRLTSGLVAFPGGGQLVFTSALQLALYQRVVVLGTHGRIEIPVPFTPRPSFFWSPEKYASAMEIICWRGSRFSGGIVRYQMLSAIP